jgi:demethylmenaquinone methyltransferase/2-methoxy-6-polyprenyl-1,4-benzoquinol methylase
LAKGPGVQKMFDGIAGRYDLMNRVMTMGQDQKWRRFVTSIAGDPEGGWTLDLATGTGDIAALMSNLHPNSKVAAGDFSQNMLLEARKRFPDKNICWHGCDANSLPFESGTFESVTFGYLLRNVDSSVDVLKEIYRVLKPGGKAVCLDTTPPAKNILYPFVKLYLRYGIPILGKMLADDEDAYAYLTGSTMDFHTADTLASMFQEAGFSSVEFKKFMMGTIAVHWGERG